MSKQLLCSALCGCATLTSFAAPSATPDVQSHNEKDPRPNILVILMDDAGYNDFGFCGDSEMSTPNIDKLVSEGRRMTDWHVSGSVSGPSRCGLLTGRYQQFFGGETNPAAEVGIPLAETLLAQPLKEAGYATAAYGKWHVGSDPDEHPNRRGFDEFYGFLGGHRNYFYSPKDTTSLTKAMQHNGKFVSFDGYLTDRLGEAAIDFIDKQHKNNTPFFVYLAYNAVHSPFQATKEDLARFEGHKRQKIAAMTWALDRSVGQVIDKLKQDGTLDNTLIFFLSDNGGDTPKDNTPLKAHKGTEFEGGHRVVGAMVWKNRIPAGKSFDGLSSSLDIYPTCLAAAGVDVKESMNLDGVDLVPYLENKKQGNPHDWLFWRIGDWHAARFNDYKLVWIDGIGDRLYNVKNNIAETDDLRESQPEIYQHMMQEIKSWETKTVKPLKGGVSSWKQVKDYMYRELLNNREPKYTNPGSYKRAKTKKLVK